MAKTFKLLVLLLLLSSCAGRMYNHYSYVKKQGTAATGKNVAGKVHKTFPAILTSRHKELTMPVNNEIAGTKIRWTAASTYTSKTTGTKNQELKSYLTSPAYKEKKQDGELAITEKPAQKPHNFWRAVLLSLCILAGIAASIYLATFFTSLPALLSLLRVPLLLPIELLLVGGLWYSARNFNRTKKDNRRHINHKLAIAGIVSTCLGLVIVNILQLFIMASIVIAVIQAGKAFLDFIILIGTFWVG